MITLNQDVRFRVLSNELLLQKVAQNILEGHSVVLTIRGNSMNPFLEDCRDQVILSPFREDDLQVGTVILAREMSGRYLLHRIIYKVEEQIVMAGDGNTGLTEETSADNVIGVLTKICRKGVWYDCDGTVWKCYSVLWMRLIPLRKILLRVIRTIYHHRL